MDAIPFLPQFGNIFFILAAFVAALSVIVAIHEYGHYIVGRWCGIKADVFSLGFGPILASRVDRHGTRWQIAALPFGGYVKFRGDANAASGTSDGSVEQLPPELKRQTMIGAPIWARTLTVAAGPVFNFVLSILVFGAVMMWQGKVSPPFTVEAVKPLPIEGITIQPGDELVSINGRVLPDFTDAERDDEYDAFVDTLPQQSLLDYEVRRDGELVNATGPHPTTIYVSSLTPRSAAISAGIQSGDVIVEVDGKPIMVFDQLVEIVETSEGRPLALTIWRDGSLIDKTLTPRRSDEPKEGGGFETFWRIGISGGFPFELQANPRGFGESLAGGVDRTWGVITGSMSGLYHMITGAISSCNMSGPIGIAQVSGNMASQGVESFIIFIAVLSTAVGLLNLFPIPVLDGGHLVFYAYEAATGRPPSERALQLLMSAGLVLILGLMVFALLNDVLCPLLGLR